MPWESVALPAADFPFLYPAEMGKTIEDIA